MNAICPPRTQLKSLVLGQLTEEQSDELLSHLDGCEICQVEMGTLDTAEDTFVGQLREASAECDAEISRETGCRIATPRALAALADVDAETG